MRVFSSKSELKQHLAVLRKDERSVGLVPTMGALHQAHLSLVNKALQENDLVVVSIFVNPTQFDKKDDLEKYPRTLTKDIELLSSVSEDIMVFAPTEEDIYDGKIISKTFDFDGLDLVMEGAFRKGHFDGVGTIVELLLTTVEPTRAYFGEKDYQQLQIIKKMVDLQGYSYDIVPCPILREPNGLAMSSRNERLSDTTKEEAGFIYSTLQTAKEKFGTESVQYIKDWVIAQFENNPLFELEYFQIADAESLQDAKEKQNDKKYRAFIAVYAEGVRLIDNIALN